MKKLKVLIVGGVAGGASTAARLRRLEEEAEIVVFEKGEYISYANCGLPYYVGEVIKDRKKLLVQTREEMQRKFNLDIRVKSEVVSIDRDKKTVIVLDHAAGRKYEESYDKLVLSPGAEPLKPPIPGIDAGNVFSLRDVPDTDAVKEYVDREKPRRAVVVGGGFIGLEMAENLKHKGIEVTLAEMADQVMAAVDPEVAAFVHNHLRASGIHLFLSNGIQAIEDSEKGTEVLLQQGERLGTDMVVLALGVKPNTALAEKAGLELGETGAIKVNEHLQTSDPDIYAVGDAVEVTDFVGRGKAYIPLAGPANKQGRIAADNLAGRGSKFQGSQGTAIVKVFDLTVATTGSSEKTLKRNRIDYRVVFTESQSHADYYPGATPLHIKTLFAPEDGRVLGAQIVGYEGVAKRIDVIASAIRFGGTVYDLQELELAYAPPYSSAKDPVNIAGFVAGNVLQGTVTVINVDEIDARDPVILDVRTKAERAAGCIPGSINIPLSKLRKRLGELPTDREIIAYCAVGVRSYNACRVLMQHGFEKVFNLNGGYNLYAAVKQDRESRKMPQQEGVQETKSVGEKEA